jgi:putative ABC transport system permease protein
MKTQNGGFFFVLRPGAGCVPLPHAFVGSSGRARSARAERVFSARWWTASPNVTVVDVRAVVASIRGVLDNITLGITVVGVVTLVSGALILIGAVAMTKFQRLYDAAIYRPWAPDPRLIATMVAVEYGLLGALAGLVGAGGPLPCRGALARYLFEIAWRPGAGVAGPQERF